MAQAANTNIVLSIAAPAGAVGDDCTDISLWSAQNAGDFLGSQAISTDPDALALGERYEIVAGLLLIDQPLGAGETEAMAQRKVNGAIAGGLWVQFHTGAPGNVGTDNVIDELDRVNIAEADFTVT